MDGMPDTLEIRLFGLPAAELRERLADILAQPLLKPELTVCGQEAVLRLTGPQERLEEAAQAARERLGLYVYSLDGSDLPARVAALQRKALLTIAAAEAGTAGGLAAALPEGQPSASAAAGRRPRRGGSAAGAASDEIAASAAAMARQARESCGTDIGLAAVIRPCGTDEPAAGCAALADARRTWVRRVPVTAGEKASAAEEARSSAAAAEGVAPAAGDTVKTALDLARRYLEAYPAVMAGGTVNAPEPPAERSGRVLWGQLISFLFPMRGDSRRRRWRKRLAWLTALLLIIGGLLWGYTRVVAPNNNRQLQDDLVKLYWNYTGDRTENAVADNAGDAGGRYPAGMVAQFRSLYDINADVAGWIRISDTSVNYPVMAYTNGYYQNHSFMDQFSAYGQPYFDELSDICAEGDGRVLMVRGNNTRDGQMFSVLLSYRRLSFLQVHPIVELNTLYTSARWEIFAVMELTAAQERAFISRRAGLTDEQSYAAFVRDLCARSLYECDLSVAFPERLLLLSTNAERDNDADSPRFLIAARETAAETGMASYRVRGAAGTVRTTLAPTTESTKTTAASLSTYDTYGSSSALSEPPSATTLPSLTDASSGGASTAKTTATVPASTGSSTTAGSSDNAETDPSGTTTGSSAADEDAGMSPAPSEDIPETDDGENGVDGPGEE